MAKKRAVKKIYEEDGFKFNTKPLFDFYRKLKEAKENKLIKSFILPTFKEQSAKSKFGAKKCFIDDNKFDSIMEAKFYVYLLGLKKEKKIKSFLIHPKFNLQESFKKDGKTIRAMDYISDYIVTIDKNKEIVFDVKGRETSDFKIKKKLFDFKYRDLTLKCVQYRVLKDEWIDIHSKNPIF